MLDCFFNFVDFWLRDILSDGFVNLFVEFNRFFQLFHPILGNQQDFTALVVGVGRAGYEVVLFKSIYKPQNRRLIPINDLGHLL